MTVRGVLVPLAVLPVLLGLLGLAGCGSHSPTQAPTGVDQLTIPTPSPDPADFVATVDNRWFPLPVGETWTYDITDPRGTHTLRVTATEGPEVAGVATTARVSSEGAETITDYVAQDDDGNVWWLGREGEWVAGVDGGEAGLLMAASPRVGDGYAMGGGETATVEAVEEDAVRLVVRTASGGTSTRSYAPDVGLVEQTDVARVVRLAD